MKFVTDRFNKMRIFLDEVKVELRKCAWPTRSELHESTIVVIVSVVGLAGFVGICDTALIWLLDLIVS